MQEFMEKVSEKNPNIKQVQYTDFLLLEEAQNKY
ncbi:unnamed protein product [Paramecium sonneborni]|uniref:Uncharacterized protein n=1 Tax=Paramecium sonneborni TaxID=65129 RepID=A0A8S1P412_9CILI|nr:unnamed protein product [Paramecium sonneborni]